MNAVSRKNLTDAGAVMRTTCASRSTPGAAFGGCHRHRAVSPDDRHLHVGCERPPAGRAWGEEGGSQMGVAHAPLGALFAATAARTAKPAAQNAAGVRPEAADWQEHRPRLSCTRRRAPWALRASQCRAGGNGAPEFRFPHPVPLLSSPDAGNQGGGKAAV
jgi:hypothetical protein